MGNMGLELIRAYPDTLEKEIKNEIIVKSMPFSAKDGDFTTTTLSNKEVFSAYIFTYPRSLERDNVAAVVATFSSMNYYPESYQKMFKKLVEEIRKLNVPLMNTLANILPDLYNSIEKSKIKLKVDPKSHIEIDFDNSSKKEIKDVAESFKEDIWG